MTMLTQRCGIQTFEPNRARLYASGTDRAGIVSNLFHFLEERDGYVEEVAYRQCGADRRRYDLEARVVVPYATSRFSPLRDLEEDVLASNTQFRDTPREPPLSLRRPARGLDPKMHVFMLTADERGLAPDLLDTIVACGGNIDACHGQLLPDYGPLGGTAFVCFRAEVSLRTALDCYQLRAALRQLKDRWSVDELIAFDLNLPGDGGLAIAA